MAVKTNARKRADRPARAAKPVTYLSEFLFPIDEVRGKNAQSDNMDYLRPLCINRVKDGQTVAVYTFSGVKKVHKSVSYSPVE